MPRLGFCGLRLSPRQQLLVRFFPLLDRPNRCTDIYLVLPTRSLILPLFVAVAGVVAAASNRKLRSIRGRQGQPITRLHIREAESQPQPKSTAQCTAKSALVECHKVNKTWMYSSARSRGVSSISSNSSSSRNCCCTRLACVCSLVVAFLSAIPEWQPIVLAGL